VKLVHHGDQVRDRTGPLLCSYAKSDGDVGEARVEVDHGTPDTPTGESGGQVRGQERRPGSATCPHHGNHTSALRSVVDSLNKRSRDRVCEFASLLWPGEDSHRAELEGLAKDRNGHLLCHQEDGGKLASGRRMP
jgi:hypothetical protein